MSPGTDSPRPDDATTPDVDIKPRSRDVTDGLEKTAARGMLRAVGMGDDDWAKPQIGVASSWNEITPCNLPLDRLAKRVKEGTHAAGGYPLSSPSVSTGPRWDMRCTSLVSRGDRRQRGDGYDAERLTGRCCSPDAKSLPGMLMAAARSTASVFLRLIARSPRCRTGPSVRSHHRRTELARAA